jgi:hypothetical protein
MHRFTALIPLLTLAVGTLLFVSGCPPDTPPTQDRGTQTGTGGNWKQTDYDLGFGDGFLVDEEYWRGFDESYDTVDAGPILYSGSEIPYLTEPAYDAGYWDGVWYAYNDGYFVAYDYAFTIGFSEGYDLGFRADWIDFLLNDEHLEYLDGGFTDGYNDGFSEGRVLGAYDYSAGLAYDWLDAMMYYREGNDVYLDEVSLGTGLDGPVELYEWGTDPNDLVKGLALKPGAAPSGGRAIRRSIGDTAKAAKVTIPDISYRSLPDNERARFNVAPATSPRSAAALNINTTWAARIDAYQAAK